MAVYLFYGDEDYNIELEIEKMRSKLNPDFLSMSYQTLDNPDYSKRLLEKSLRHNTIHALRRIERNDISSSLNPSFAFCSRVKMVDGSIRHIPQLDFHIRTSPQNLNVVCDVCRFLRLGPGWILNSGESYHFIGKIPITWKKLSNILYTAIVFNPIIDTIWVSHQLREGCCSLRIGEKNGVFPVVIREL